MFDSEPGLFKVRRRSGLLAQGEFEADVNYQSDTNDAANTSVIPGQTDGLSTSQTGGRREPQPQPQLQLQLEPEPQPDSAPAAVKALRIPEHQQLQLESKGGKVETDAEIPVPVEDFDALDSCATTLNSVISGGDPSSNERKEDLRSTAAEGTPLAELKEMRCARHARVVVTGLHPPTDCVTVAGCGLVDCCSMKQLRAQAFRLGLTEDDLDDALDEATEQNAKPKEMVMKLVMLAEHNRKVQDLQKYTQSLDEVYEQLRSLPVK